MATTKSTKVTAVKKAPAKARSTSSVQAAAKPAVKKTVAAPAKARSTSSVQAEAPIVKGESVQLPVVDVTGKAAGHVSAPAELFAAKVNKQLVAQAVRIYQGNQREGGASTKTRGEVEGSTRKIYKQKGTGRARHGGIRAPIFVGGGITFGPKPRDYSATMPQKMKRLALASALTSQLAQGTVIVVDGLTEVSGKTKTVAQALTAIGANSKKTLLVIAPKAADTQRSARNIRGVDVAQVLHLHTYEVLSHRSIVFTKEAVQALTGVKK